MRSGLVLGVLAWILLAGCHAKGEVAPPSSAAAAQHQEEMLDALVIPPSEGEIAYAQCPYEPDDVPPIDAIRDADLPEFSASRTRASNWERGEERLDDVTLSQHLAPMQAEVMRCIDLAACYVPGDDLFGQIEMELEVTSEGRVRAASIDASEQLQVDPVMACTRSAISQLRFPSVDGGNTFVTYAMTIE